MFLIYGFYGKGNIGDELFKKAFLKLFPNQELKFVSHLVESDINSCQCVIFGGGSFLGGKLSGTPKAVELLFGKKIFYIGVGIESYIDPIHVKLLSHAKLIATRSLDQIDRIKTLCDGTVIFLPDLVYILCSGMYSQDRAKTIFIPNALVLPKNKDPHWKHASWNYFKSEFSQFLDYLIEQGEQIDIMSMCDNPETKDHYAAIEIINLMHYGKQINIFHCDIDLIDYFVAQYQFIITQRFHGIILSQMTQTPYLAISHHDKLLNAQPMQGQCLSYYGVTKNQLIQAFQSRNSQKIDFETNLQDFIHVAELVLQELI